MSSVAANTFAYRAPTSIGEELDVASALEIGR